MNESTILHEIDDVEQSRPIWKPAGGPRPSQQQLVVAKLDRASSAKTVEAKPSAVVVDRVALGCVHSSPPDIHSLKRAYKLAKYASKANPEDAQLALAYTDAKRTYIASERGQQ